MMVISGPFGVEQGDVVLFSDFENDGEMWTGEGTRVRKKVQNFTQRFKSPPMVHCSLSMWDVDTSRNSRIDVEADNVTEDSFEIVFTTWGDTHIARVRVAWMAVGEVDLDGWELF